MTHALRIGIAGFFGLFLAIPALADDTTDAEDTSPVPAALQADAGATLADFQWVNRPVIVFADTENDPRFATQMDLIAAGVDQLLERDVVVLTDTDPTTLSPLREKLRPRGFMMVLIGKDGGVKLRKPFPYDVREISRSIDKMPMRQREIRERRDGS